MEIYRIEKDEQEDYHSLVEGLSVFPDLHKIIAAIGGKERTDLLFALGRELAEAGYHVILTTTTRMRVLDGYLLDSYESDDIRKAFEKDNLVVMGVEAEPGKIEGETDNSDLPLDLLDYCDLVLVDADRSKGKSFKIPNENEPELPAGVDLVLGTFGSSALGKTFREVCYHSDFARKLLDKNGDDIVTPKDMGNIFTQKEGLFKEVDCECRCVVSVDAGYYLEEAFEVMRNLEEDDYGVVVRI